MSKIMSMSMPIEERHGSDRSFFRDLQDGRTSFVLQEQKKKEEGLPRIKNVPRRSSAAARARLTPPRSRGRCAF